MLCVYAYEKHLSRVHNDLCASIGIPWDMPLVLLFVVRLFDGAFDFVN